MARQTERFAVKLPEELKDRMKEYSDEIGISMSAVATLAIRAYLDSQDTIKAISRAERMQKLQADTGK